MRCGIALACLAAVLLAAAAWAYERPTLVLRDVLDRDQGIPAEADWHSQRIFEGIGWKLGTIARPDNTVMMGGFTVVQPSRSAPIVFKHCYVLAAWDMMPRGILLVTVRDPQLYWKNYNYEQGVRDPLELVWYDDKWQEEYNTVLDYGRDDFPDNFRLSPDQKYLIAIRHPLDLDGEPLPSGHTLDLIYLNTGLSEPLWLPEITTAEYPAAWWPLRIDWGPQDELMVQAGQQLRIYEVQWQ